MDWKRQLRGIAGSDPGPAEDEAKAKAKGKGKVQDRDERGPQDRKIGESDAESGTPATSNRARKRARRMAEATVGDPVAASTGKAASPPSSSKAPLIEIFHSIQGEGRFVGRPMVFVRTATCPLRCLYCDTPDSYEAAPRFPVRLGVRDQHEQNPVSAQRAAELVALCFTANPAGGAGQAVSLTGGEPLVFPDFIGAFGRALRDKGTRLHLETAAIDPEALAQCVTAVDHLSADFKLPETLGAPVGGPAVDGAGGYGERHVQCCEIALRRGATVDVKIVLTPAVDDPSLERGLDLLEPLRRKILLVLQPVTPFGKVTTRLPRRDLERYVASAARRGFDVRVLPQVHKALQLP